MRVHVLILNLASELRKTEKCKALLSYYHCCVTSFPNLKIKERIVTCRTVSFYYHFTPKIRNNILLFIQDGALRVII